MRDLEFWRSLRHRLVDEAGLVANLHAVAEWPVHERLPFLGFLTPFAGHADSNVRAATLRCLGGCLGTAAFEILVRGLNDVEQVVREAAVEALRDSLSGGDWARWAHAMFHPRADVRRAAMRSDRSFPPPDWWAIYLLPDAETRAAAENKIEALTIPVEVLPAIMGYVRQGILSGTTARRWIARLSWPAIVEFFQRWGDREVARCDAMIACLDDPDGGVRLNGIAGFHPLDDLFALFVDATEPEMAASLRHLLEYACLNEDSAKHVRASLLMAIRNHPSISVSPLAAILAVVHARAFLSCAWLPLALRKAALPSLYEHASKLMREEDDRPVCQLIDSDLCLRPDVSLDLVAVGAVAQLFKDSPYRRLLAHKPIAAIAAAFEADPEGSIPFFTLADNSAQGRRYLIRELCLQAKTHRGRLLALLCRVLPADGLDFLEAIDAAVAAEIALEIIVAGGPVSPKKSRRLAGLLATKIAAGQCTAFISAWIGRPTPENDDFGLLVLSALCRLPEMRVLDQAVRALPTPSLRKFLRAADVCAGFPYDRELSLARSLIEHGDDGVRSWAAARLQRFTPKRRELREQDRVGLLRAGLCHRLRSEPDPDAPSVEICASLLASHDLFAEVDAQFARFSSLDPEFIKRLDEEMVHHWRGEKRLPGHGHMWLFRWNEHLNWFADGRSVVELLSEADTWLSPILRRRRWEACERLIESLRWSNRPSFDAIWTDELGQILAKNLAGDAGPIAARIMQLLRRHAPDSAWLARVRPMFVAQLTATPAEVREALSDWIDSRGLPAAVEPSPVPPPSPQRDISGLAGLIARYQGAASEPEASSILQALLALGDDGSAALADLLCGSARVHFAPIAAAALVALPECPALQRIRAALHDREVPPETRFRIGVALAQQDRTNVLPQLLAILLEASEPGWFGAGDWHWLLNFARGLGWEDTQIEMRLAASPHPHAYDPAVMGLTRVEIYSSIEIQNALIAFLECGTTRMRELRAQAANWLYKSGNWHSVVPLLLQAEVADPPTYPDLLAGLHYDLIRTLVRGIMILNRGETDETFVFNLLLAEGVDTFVREEGLSLLMQHAYSTSIRQRARENLRPSHTRELKLRRVAGAFAWGIRVGRELTGKLFGIQMISGEQLGYTRFTENKIYISPLPILRGEMHGREVVRALILHEFGHHMYHRGEEAQAVWKESEREGLQKLLNLVSDEHLERNLRALDRRFGDQLKLLAAYAFQHNAREIHVENLFTALQDRAFEVLSAAPMQVARRYGCVAIHNGRVLTLMEKAGLSFARFVRSLRMGLGNRHDDPKVEAGLALFKGRFRKSDMPRLYDISKKLREIFGWETDILNSFDQDALAGDEAGDWDEVSEGITDAEVQAEVQNNLQGKDRRTSDNARGGRGLNLGLEEHFDLIDKVQPMPFDPAQHASYAQQVARPAQLLRDYLKKLGIGFRQQRLRLTGKSFDRTRARAMVLKGDPRMLIARELKIQTDLFIGVVVDCSGSMSHNANIEKAKLFGTLIAEAARNYPGVDARMFGFTDQVIYDAGHANRCAIHALQAGGGNNDAAGLWHAALQAKASRRRAKLLVMISDGAPTECSVNALRSLVTRLTKRMKICCAQVGVCPLEHQCFPNYILLDNDNVAASVREFGIVMARLVQKALRGG